MKLFEGFHLCLEIGHFCNRNQSIEDDLHWTLKIINENQKLDFCGSYLQIVCNILCSRKKYISIALEILYKTPVYPINEKR